MTSLLIDVENVLCPLQSGSDTCMSNNTMPWITNVQQISTTTGNVTLGYAGGKQTALPAPAGNERRVPFAADSNQNENTNVNAKT